ncbi:MAG: hypothetical protein ACI4KA_00995 [Oscillospiraceae bacterium]
MNNDIIIALISTGVPALATVFNVVYTNYKTKHKKQTAEEEEEQKRRDEISENTAMGLQCLLRAEIIRCHEKYKEKGFCPVYAREALQREYTAYHNLGGNDVATDLYNDILALPTERRNDHED